MPDPRNILAMRLGGIGEILIITPALRSVRRRYPSARITLLSESTAVDLLDGLGLVDEIVVASEVYRARGWFWPLSIRFYAELFSLVGRITSRKYDLFLDFQHLYTRVAPLKPALVGFLSRAPRRIGFGDARRGFFLTDRVPDDRSVPEHLLYRNRRFLRPLGLEPDERVEMRVDEAARREAERLASEGGFRNGAFVVGVNPGSSRPATQWEEGRFVEVLRRLVESKEAKVVLVGSMSDVTLCERISRAVPGCVTLAGKNDLSTLAALMDYFDLFLSNDTGPVHVSRAFGVPTVGIYRPGEYPIWGSYRDRTFEGIHRPVPCAPCVLYRCRHHTCLKLIEPADVLAAVDRVLAHEPAARA